MMRNYVLLYHFGIFTFIATNTAAREAIVGGKIAGVDQFPYQVSLIFHGHGHDCGGVIIDNSHILTAAHCVVQNDCIDHTPVYVLAGTNNLLNSKKPAVIVPVKKIFVPREYRRAVGSENDIAVLSLIRPLELSQHIKKVDLPSHKNENYDEKTAIISGFGWDWIKKEDEGRNKDSHLRYAEVHITKHCLQGQNLIEIPEKLLCGRITHHDANKSYGVCHGDSGSPLVYDGTVIGVLSFGPKDCREKEFASLYTRVSHYLDFIEHARHNRHHDNIITLEIHH